jgi:hypothetical protein
MSIFLCSFLVSITFTINDPSIAGKKQTEAFWPPKTRSEGRFFDAENNNFIQQSITPIINKHPTKAIKVQKDDRKIILFY